MKKSIKLSLILLFFFSMSVLSCMQKKGNFCLALLHNAQNVNRCNRELQELAQERHNDNVTIIKNTDTEKIFIQEQPYPKFLGLIWEKAVQTFTLKQGPRDGSAQGYIPGDKVDENNQGFYIYTEFPGNFSAFIFRWLERI